MLFLEKLDAGLYLVATPIGNLGDITLRAVEVLANVDLIACEDTRETKKLLGLLNIDRKMNELISVHDQNEKAQSEKIIKLINDGKRVAYVSDAGMPAISDPGALLVQVCHEHDAFVTCIPGVSSATTAVALSGYACTSFSFYGFFPRVKKEQEALLSKIESSDELSVIFESPHRLSSTLDLLAERLGADRDATICRELTKKFEEVVKSSLGELRSKFSGGTKGECVIVINSSNLQKSYDASELAASITKMKHAGMSSKDVIEALENIVDAPKNQLKQIYSEI